MGWGDVGKTQIKEGNYNKPPAACGIQTVDIVNMARGGTNKKSAIYVSNMAMAI